MKKLLMSVSLIALVVLLIGCANNSMSSGSGSGSVSNNNNNNNNNGSPLAGNASLNGSYAFLFNGFDAGGAMAATGSFTADGHGNLTAGIEDISRSSGVTTSLTFTGTYSVGPNNLGSLTLGSSLGTSTLHFALDSKGNAHFIEFDSSGTRGSGIMKKQDATAFSTSAINGDYALGFTGNNAVGGRVGAVGSFNADGTGNLTQGATDVNDAGIVIGSSSWTGSYSVSSNGRGTAVLFGAANFIFYVVSAGELFFLSTHSPTLLRSGLVLRQSGVPFSVTSLKGSSVFSLTGLNNTESSVTVGQIVADGLGGAIGLFDQNDAGTVFTNVKFTGTYSIGPNGRGTLDFQIQPTISISFVFYLVNQNQAFLLEVSGSEVRSGLVEPQILGNASFAGVFAGGTINPAVISVPDASGVFNLNGSGNFTGTEDQSDSAGLAANVAVTGAYAVSSNGRGTIAFASPAASNAVFYTVSPTEFVLISVDSSNTVPVVFVFEE